MGATRRQTGDRHVFAPFEELVASVRANGVTSWVDIESSFLAAVESFDSEYASGNRSTGWYQSKARYFNDLIVLLLSNMTGSPVASRCKRRSQLFDLIDIDICFPETGDPIIAAEVKALGTPPHPGNDDRPRAAKADLHKRIREVAFTATDLKAAYARPAPIRSLQEWIDRTSPGYFAFWAIRAADDGDLNSVRTTLSSLRAYCNGVGAVFYTAASPDSPTRYQVRRLPDLSIDRTIREIAQRLTGAIDRA